MTTDGHSTIQKAIKRNRELKKSQYNKVSLLLWASLMTKICKFIIITMFFVVCYKFTSNMTNTISIITGKVELELHFAGYMLV